ncbi:MAG: class I SAM-dependent methyltransferase [Syntrophomonadaceae bacterium]|nr:class I SAM-dependent methyltransferase [Syntrophomonadaceae bacterium]
MNELSQKLNQCKRPSGEPGKLIADMMNESHYALTTWGMEMFSIAPDSTILDVGCGGGRTIYRMTEIASEGKVFGIDYSPDCVAWSSAYNEEWIKEGRVEILHSPVNELPFKDNFFDIVTAVETVYFWPDLAESFKEIKRVLKPGGKFIIINEVYKSELFRERNEAYTAAGDMQIFAPEELKQLLEDVQFKNVTTAVVKANNWLCCIGEK